MAVPEGARDFDFLIGDWSVRHQRLGRRLAHDTNWVEFEGPASVRVRFIWTAVSPTTCRWEQAFSADGERSWETNWTMEFRASPARR